MHFGDPILLFVIALILFGPKKLPEMARQFAKLMAEFRRASNEFKTQIDEELRSAEQAERQKQISASATPAGVGGAGALSAGSGFEPGAGSGEESAAVPVILPPAVGAAVSRYAYDDPAVSEGAGGPGAVLSEVGPAQAEERSRPHEVETTAAGTTERKRPYGDLFREETMTFAPTTRQVGLPANGASTSAPVNGASADITSGDAIPVEGSAAENAQASIHHV